jgi:hypothetical protein
VKADGSEAGYFIAPGTLLPDGRHYELIDAPRCNLGRSGTFRPANADPAPRAVLYRATFNRTERARIETSPELRRAIDKAPPSNWDMIIRQFHAESEAKASASAWRTLEDAPAMRRQAPSDLREATQGYGPCEMDGESRCSD